MLLTGPALRKVGLLTEDYFLTLMSRLVLSSERGQG